MKWAVNVLKEKIQKAEYRRDNYSQPRIGYEIMSREIEELEEGVKILEAEYEKRDQGKTAIDAIKSAPKAYGLEMEEEKKEPQGCGCLIIAVIASIFLAGIVYIITGIVKLIQLLF